MSTYKGEEMIITPTPREKRGICLWERLGYRGYRSKCKNVNKIENCNSYDD
jgi:hypothetical protein